MLSLVIDAKHIKNHKVWIAFNDGKSGEIDLTEKLNRLKGEVFEPLHDVSYFKNFKIVGHTLSWENGADIAPESLHDLLVKNLTKKSN